MQGIRKHVTDTAGAVDHVFDLCHLLGFRLAPRICDLNERRLYGLSLFDLWSTLRPFVAAPVTVSAIEADCVETLRLAASIQAGTVNALIMLRKLAGFRVKNSVARALLEIGRIERTVSCLTGLTIPNSGVAPAPSLTRVKPGMCSPAPSPQTVSANCTTAHSRTRAIVPPG